MSDRQDQGASADADRAGGPADLGQSSLSQPEALIPCADYPPGAIGSREEFVAGVEANGRQKKTPVYMVSKGGLGHPIPPYRETIEFIWPLKFSDEMDRGSADFVADVRGRVHSLRDRHIIPNGYNRNFAFFDAEAADAYAESDA
jgi:hypothetical protein